MNRFRIIVISFIIISFIFFNKCKEDIRPITLTLYDQPLNVIQSYIKGKWRLQYIYGGLLAKKHIDSYNSYLILSSDHITRGNDSTGVIVDTTIVWVRAKVWGNDSTYLLSYSWRGYNWPEYYIIDQIKDDTLIIKDYVDDGFNYYYTKF